MFDARNPHNDTGIDLDYRTRYQISLETITPLKDNSVECDFSGWNEAARRDSALFHTIASHVSRMRGKPLFTLVGEVGKQQIDLGALWREAGNAPFELCLADHFPDREVNGRLIVYLNDVRGFYHNNSGTFRITIS